jgi:hypothetical protein
VTPVGERGAVYITDAGRTAMAARCALDTLGREIGALGLDDRLARAAP